MNNRSFSSRLSWRIIGIVSAIFLASFIIIGLVFQYVITNENRSSASLILILSLLLVGIVGLVIVFFVCRREIRRMTRPITELSVSALNMAKGNFKAKLPDINSKDLIDIYLDGEQLPGSQFHLKILPGALPLRLPKVESV